MATVLTGFYLTLGFFLAVAILWAGAFCGVRLYYTWQTTSFAFPDTTEPPKPDRVYWYNVPRDYKYMVRNGDGGVLVCTEKPVWDDTGKIWLKNPSADWIMVKHIVNADYIRGNCAAEDSLVERPW